MKTFQHQIESTEEHYPQAEPPDPANDENRSTNNWFTDENFQAGNEDFYIDTASDEYFDLEVVSDATSVETRDTNASRKEWRKKPTLSFVEIDQHAKSVRVALVRHLEDLYFKVSFDVL